MNENILSELRRPCDWWTYSEWTHLSQPRCCVTARLKNGNPFELNVSDFLDEQLWELMIEKIKEKAGEQGGR